MNTEEFINTCLNHKGQFIFNDNDDDYDPESDFSDDIQVYSMTFQKAEKDYDMLIFSNPNQIGQLAINILSIEDINQKENSYHITTTSQQNTVIKLI